MIKHQRQVLRQEMERHLREWEQSGISQREYCHAHNLSYAKLVYWIQRLRQDQLSEEIFVPVKPGQAPGQFFKDAELIYPNGVRMKVSVQNLEQLSRLIRLV